MEEVRVIASCSRDPVRVVRFFRSCAPMSQDYASLICGMPIFQGFTPSGAQRLLELGQVVEHGAGQPLCREGDPADSVLLILGGRLRVYVERQGSEIVVSDFSAGAILGEIAVLCGLPRAASVRTLEPATVLRWPADAFRSLMLSDVFLSQRIFSSSLRFLIEQEKSLIESLAERR
jgi:CRP/FNR family transcriptional regulator, cyclic AMP receptor protein